ncbi:hypothetical protein V5799_009112 [Amblyomma americanum]|uniref:Uncharacterized protein n=1 Tax=Amblyomma americanum TaxID=6943 RepID=A0AAQ4FCH1_AMBAM
MTEPRPRRPEQPIEYHCRSETAAARKRKQTWSSEEGGGGGGAPEGTEIAHEHVSDFYDFYSGAVRGRLCWSR